MKRKETYATTGPRMTVRFFGGWNFTAEDAETRLPAAAGYTKGVPMGGDLRTAPQDKAPTFLVAALKDPYSGNLDRIQIVMGWLDKDGNTAEKVYDVVWSGDRKPGADGKLPPVGNTVNVAKATDQHHRCARTDQRVDHRSEFRCIAAGVLLCPRHRDSDAALDRLRGAAVRRADDPRCADDDPGTRIYLADLVYAVTLMATVCPLPGRP